MVTHRQSAPCPKLSTDERSLFVATALVDPRGLGMHEAIARSRRSAAGPLTRRAPRRQDSQTAAEHDLGYRVKIDAVDTSQQVERKM
jgi:hypothetical protein